MTERLDAIVAEMRKARIPSLMMYAGQIQAAAALERAEHRRELMEALAPSTKLERMAFVTLDELLSSRRARYGKEG